MTKITSQQRTIGYLAYAITILILLLLLIWIFYFLDGVSWNVDRVFNVHPLCMVLALIVLPTQGKQQTNKQTNQATYSTMYINQKQT
jgi:hypothetical protein